jgi:resuscitation-promoting factor RpfB
LANKNSNKRDKWTEQKVHNKFVQKLRLYSQKVASFLSPFFDKIAEKLQFNKYRLIYSWVLFVLIIVCSALMLTKEKTIQLQLDGVNQEVKTHQFITDMYTETVAEEHGINDYRVAPDTKIFLNSSDKVVMSSLKEINVRVNGKPKKITTYADNLKQFLDGEQGEVETTYGEKYSYFVKKYPTHPEKVLLKNIKSLDIDLLSKSAKEKKVETKYKVRYINNSKLESGQLYTKQEGVNTIAIKVFETIFLNDKKYKKVTRIKKVLQKGQDKIIIRGTKVTGVSNSVWDRLAKCETGGRWHANTGNGFYGGLQFSAPTWRTASRRVGIHIPYAHQASKAQQIKAAIWLQRNSGWGQWPACSAKLGLR